MESEAQALRARTSRLARAKTRIRERDDSAHMARSLGERLALTLRLCDEHIERNPDLREAPDDAVAVWSRVRRRLPDTG